MVSIILNMSDGHLIAPRLPYIYDPQDDVFVVEGWGSPPSVEGSGLGDGDYDDLSDLDECHLDSPSHCRSGGRNAGTALGQHTGTDTGVLFAVVGCFIGDDCVGGRIDEMYDDKMDDEKSLGRNGGPPPRVEEKLPSACSRSKNTWGLSLLRRVFRGPKKVSFSDEPDQIHPVECVEDKFPDSPAGKEMKRAAFWTKKEVEKRMTMWRVHIKGKEEAGLTSCHCKSCETEGVEPLDAKGAHTVLAERSDQGYPTE